MDRSNGNLRGWLRKNSLLDRLERRKLNALKQAIECVTELVRDPVWMARHDPARELDQVELLLAKIGKSALAVPPSDLED